MAITDDTQMTLFTVEGLIRATAQVRATGSSDAAGMVRQAYWRWLTTQGEFPRETSGGPDRSTWTDGWLMHEPVLQARRAPGNSCLSALRSGRLGTPARPINDSKGCGTVMRGAPVGFATFVHGDTMFDLGCQIGALTHGHPTGYSAAGALAVIVERLCSGETLQAGVGAALAFLQRDDRFSETRRALDAAIDLAAQGRPSASAVASLGRGWIAEEALAIAVYAALAATTFEEALVLAVNHGGDSDSTGAICGHLLGVQDGVFAIPSHYLEHLEGMAVMTKLADEFAEVSVVSPGA